MYARLFQIIHQTFTRLIRLRIYKQLNSNCILTWNFQIAIVTVINTKAKAQAFFLLCSTFLPLFVSYKQYLDMNPSAKLQNKSLILMCVQILTLNMSVIRKEREKNDMNIILKLTLLVIASIDCHCPIWYWVFLEDI